jgi:hypothetical protein
MGSITKSNPVLATKFASREREKNQHFRLHLLDDLCIIIARPPPRWAKWSRGVRTRGLRVGLVGGPRPLYFLPPSFSRAGARFQLSQIRFEPLDFTKKWHNIRHDDELELIRLNQMNQQATSQVDASPQ